MMRQAATTATLLTCLLWPCTPRAQTTSTAPVSSADELVGLWKAARRFGPDARGPLVIEKTASGWSADFIGHIFPVRSEGSELTFALPDGEGSFIGRLQTHGRAITGHWTPPNSVVHGSKFAVPVTLAAAGPDRWQGLVEPLDDDCDFYLMVRKLADGSLGAFVRNPDRNLGLQYGIDRIVRDGNAVTLVGRIWNQGAEIALFHGKLDPSAKVISIVFPDQGGTYDFARDDNRMSGFYPRGRQPEHYIYRAPLKRDDGWLTGTLDDAKIDRAGIEKFIQTIVDMPIDSVHTPEVEAILIARHGKLVLEEYFHGFNRDTLHDTRSAGKA